MSKEACCACDSPIKPEKMVLIEYLYLDLNTCERCIGTEKELDKVVSTLTPALEIAGYTVDYQKIEIVNEKLAEKYQFLSSPTVRVNGEDVCQSVMENNCGCCGEISGTDVDCRVFEFNGETHEVAPKELLAEGIFQRIYGMSSEQCSCGEYKLPENLKTFFQGLEKKNCS